MWAALKDCQLGYHFAFQVPLLGYIVDFYCRAKRLVIEVDGAYHNEPKQAQADALRELHLEQRASAFILRFTNAQVLNDIAAVLLAIRRELGYPT